MGHPVHIVPSPVNRGSCFMLPRRQHCPEKSIIYLWRYATLFLSNIHTFFFQDMLFLSDMTHFFFQICILFQHRPEKNIYLWKYVTPYLSNTHTFFQHMLFLSDMSHLFFQINILFFPEKSIIYLLRYAALFLLNIHTYFFQDMLFVSDMSHFFFQINLLFSALSWKKHHLSFKICRTFSSEYTWWSLYNQSLLKLSENNNVGCKVTAEN